MFLNTYSMWVCLVALSCTTLFAAEDVDPASLKHLAGFWYVSHAEPAVYYYKDKVQEFQFRLPFEPKLNDHITRVPMGPIGVALNGVVFFNPFEAGGMNAVEGYSEVWLDSCCGHPEPEDATVGVLMDCHIEFKSANRLRVVFKSNDVFRVVE